MVLGSRGSGCLDATRPQRVVDNITRVPPRAGITNEPCASSGAFDGVDTSTFAPTGIPGNVTRPSDPVVAVRGLPSTFTVTTTPTAGDDGLPATTRTISVPAGSAGSGSGLPSATGCASAARPNTNTAITRATRIISEGYHGDRPRELEDLGADVRVKADNYAPGVLAHLTSKGFVGDTVAWDGPVQTPKGPLPFEHTFKKLDAKTIEGKLFLGGQVFYSSKCTKS